MRYAILMWGNTRMIVLSATCAAIYAATLLAFKTAIPLIPGITEVRVANVFPMAFGIMFGPAAAWGLAIGNLIGDIFGGTLGPGSIAGFFGNFLLGYIPYVMWTNFFPLSPPFYVWDRKKPRHWVNFMVINFVSSACCAIIISTFLDFLGLVPYPVLSKIITINDTIGGIISVFLLIAVYETVKKQLGLIWIDVMMLEEKNKRSPLKTVGCYILLFASILGIFGPHILPLSYLHAGAIASALIIVGTFIL
ncbi:MAG: QueT transporter family protein [Deltaproteobacteria bacterium]|nr:QueT transporter family protein [Deltaproteobacteria bacterium]